MKSNKQIHDQPHFELNLRALLIMMLDASLINVSLFVVLDRRKCVQLLLHKTVAEDC